MKKTWVKRENIYYKPFYKQKTKMTLLAIFLLAIVFFSYQLFYINQLPNTSTPLTLESTFLPRESNENRQKNANGEVVNDVEDGIKIIRGIRLRDYDAYRPSYDGKFRCLTGEPIEIAFSKVNDDYCDCLADGSDEPSTNACVNGKFYCKFQKRHITGRGLDLWVPSSRINDGICDCCDGSDEWRKTDCENKCE